MELEFFPNSFLTWEVEARALKSVWTTYQTILKNKKERTKEAKEEGRKE